MDRLRIVEFVTYAGIGGMQQMLAQYLRHASHDRYELYVCALLERNWLLEEAEKLHIPQTALNFRGYWDLAAWWRFYRFLRGKQIDLIRTYGLKAHIIGRIVGRLAGVRVNITSVRSTDPWRKWYHVLLDRLTSGLTDLYISNSEAGRLITHQREQIALSKILTIPNGIDLAVFNPAQIPQYRRSLRQEFGIDATAPVIGFVANFRKMKGHATLVDALPRIREQFPTIRCLFVGETFVKEPDYEAELRQSVCAKGLDQVVVFTGVRHDIPAVLSLCDVFVSSSLWEGLPTAILEAMAMQRPVVATAVGGTPELVEEHVTGLFIPAQNPGALADAVLALLRDPEYAQRLGQAGYARVQRMFSLKAVVAQTEAIYARLLTP